MPVLPIRFVDVNVTDLDRSVASGSEAVSEGDVSSGWVGVHFPVVG